MPILSLGRSALIVEQDDSMALMRNTETRYSKPVEDSVKCDPDNGIWVVADGVTRLVPDDNYPQESYSAQISELFCSTFHAALLAATENYLIPGEEKVADAVRIANQSVKDRNRKLIPDPDFLFRDLPSTTFAGAYQEDSILHWTTIADTIIYTATGSELTQVTSDSTMLIDKLWEAGLVPNNEFQGIVRKCVRNNPKATIEDVLRHGSLENSEHQAILERFAEEHPTSDLSWGVVSGQDTVMDFVEAGKIDLTQVDGVYIASDGLEKLFKNAVDLGRHDLIVGKSPADLVLSADALEIENGYRSDDKSVVFIPGLKDESRILTETPFELSELSSPSGDYRNGR